jgi:DTW domain-containing protein YfiP
MGDTEEELVPEHEGSGDQEGDEQDRVQDLLMDFCQIPADPPSKRSLCEDCGRPVPVCWCPFLSKGLSIRSKLFILQHPSEEKRCLRTAKILELSLPAGQCVILKGKKFSVNKYPELSDFLRDKDRTLLMFPSISSLPLKSLPCVGPEVPLGYNVLIVDGTWSQARSIYHNSPDLHSLTKVEVNSPNPSTYVIRTQPTEECLSTVETAALALSHLENQPELYEALTKPLGALCSFQLDHGAVHHYSKEYLILNGLYDRPVTRKIKKKLRKHQDIKNSIR